MKKVSIDFSRNLSSIVMNSGVNWKAGFNELGINLVNQE